MTTDDWSARLQRILGVSRPNAKFVSISDSSTFIDPAAALGDGFVYVNLYDEDVDNNVFSFRGRIVMIHNTYLASFAYNLFLSWLYAHARPNEASLNRLLAHNFKKFFAEQLWRQRDDVASRALLLETLLYEQVCMVPVFAAQAKDQALEKASQDAASIMSLLLSMHELGHIMLDSRSDARAEFRAELPKSVAPLFDDIARRMPEPFLDEFRCDIAAVLSCVTEHRKGLEPAFVLRVIAFAFSAYAVMFSLSKSANAYRDERERHASDVVDLRSIEKRHTDHTIPIGTDRDFAERAKVVVAVCEALSKDEGIVLFDESGLFPLPATVGADLLASIGRVLDCDDSNARAMANLVSESLYGHSAGMEYLYLRSKTFRSNRELPHRI